MIDPEFIKIALDEFSDNLSKNPDTYNTKEMDALLNSLYRALNAIENKPVSS